MEKEKVLKTFFITEFHDDFPNAKTLIDNSLTRICCDLGLLSPVASLYIGQCDAENDCIVLDNIASKGYVKYNKKVGTILLKI